MTRRVLTSFVVTMSFMLPIGWVVNGGEIPPWYIISVVLGALAGNAIAELLKLWKE